MPHVSETADELKIEPWNIAMTTLKKHTPTSPFDAAAAVDVFLSFVLLFFLLSSHYRLHISIVRSVRITPSSYKPWERSSKDAPMDVLRRWTPRTAARMRKRRDATSQHRSASSTRPLWYATPRRSRVLWTADLSLLRRAGKLCWRATAPTP